MKKRIPFIYAQFVAFLVALGVCASSVYGAIYIIERGTSSDTNSTGGNITQINAGLGINVTNPNGAIVTVAVNSLVCLSNGSNCPASSGDNTSWNQSYANTLYYPRDTNPQGFYNSSTLPADSSYNVSYLVRTGDTASGNYTFGNRTNTLFIDETSGNVRIGNRTSTVGKLTVHGGYVYAQGDEGIGFAAVGTRFPSGDLGTAIMAYNNLTRTGSFACTNVLNCTMGTNTNAEFHLMTQSAARLSIDTTGNINIFRNLSVDTPDFHVDTTNSRVGFGTRIPSYPVHINGSSSNIPLYVYSTGATSAIRMDGNGTTGLHILTSASTSCRLDLNNNGASGLFKVYSGCTNFKWRNQSNTDQFIINSNAAENGFALTDIGVGIGTATPEGQFVVRNTTATHFFINQSSGNIGIGGITNPSQILEVTAEVPARRGMAIAYYYDDVQSGNINIRKARGTIASPSSPLAGDTIGGFGMQGYSGTAFVNAGFIRVLAVNNFNTTNSGSYMRFDTTPVGSTTVTERMRINANGTITIAGLTGSGTDYLCVDSGGTLWRSNTAC